MVTIFVARTHINIFPKCQTITRFFFLNGPVYYLLCIMLKKHQILNFPLSNHIFVRPSLHHRFLSNSEFAMKAFYSKYLCSHLDWLDLSKSNFAFLTWSGSDVVPVTKKSSAVTFSPPSLHLSHLLWPFTHLHKIATDCLITNECVCDRLTGLLLSSRFRLW